MAGVVANLTNEAPLLRDDVRPVVSHHPPRRRHAVTKTQHHIVGHVSGINPSYENGNNARIEVTHGKRSKGKPGSVPFGGSRPTSSITVPKAHAKNYTLGQRVAMGIGDAPSAAMPPAPKKGAKKVAKKQAAKKSARRGPSMIQQAMLANPAAR